MNGLLVGLAILPVTLAVPASQPSAERVTVVVVTGAAGSVAYGRQFGTWAGRWSDAATAAGARLIRVGSHDTDKRRDRERLKGILEREVSRGEAELWLVLLGHGTFDGRVAKFNLRGPDVTDTEIAEWLGECRRPTIVINCTAASAPFLSRLAAPGRVVITATRSGHETSFARFGDQLSRAIASPAADLDKDGQTSLLEAFLVASNRTQAFYRDAGRLATEHALLDDNGDGRGTRAEWFRGTRPERRSQAGDPVDGLRAGQLCLVKSPAERALPPAVRRRRDQLERQLAELRDRRESLDDDAWFRELESLLVPLAELYEQHPPVRR